MDESDEHCPGESCPRFQSAAEPKAEACRTCTICEGRLPQKRDVDAELVAEHIRRLTLERDACPQVFSKRNLTHLEVELLVYWHEVYEQLSGASYQLSGRSRGGEIDNY